MPGGVLGEGTGGPDSRHPAHSDLLDRSPVVSAGTTRVSRSATAPATTPTSVPVATLDSTAAGSNQPTSKSVLIRLEPTANGPGA